MRCRAVPCSCRAVQYSAGLCRAVPCACFVVLILSCMPGIVRSIIPGTGTPTGSYITNIVESQKIHSQLSLAQLYLSSAAQRRAVPCHALRCCTSPCCAVPSFEHTTVPGAMRSNAYQAPACTHAIVFLLSSLGCPLLVLFMLFFHKITPVLTMRT